MPDYRLYTLDPFSGHITGAEELHAADDVSAVHQIQQRRFAVPVELWSGRRKITRLDAPPEAAALAPATRPAPRRTPRPPEPAASPTLQQS